MSQQFVGSRGPLAPHGAGRHGGAALALLMILGGAIALGAAPAAASIWGGHNGVVRLCFAPPDSAGADSLRAVANIPAPGPEGTMLDVYAVLDGVEAIYYQGAQVRALGGFELKLAIDGAPGVIVSQEFPFSAFNVAQAPGACSVGVTNRGELPIRGGRATLVHWTVHFAAAPKNVRFHLDPQGLPTCKGLSASPNGGAQVPGCPESGAQALWAGSAVSNLEGLIFGCTSVPAYLNWEGSTDLVVPAGKPSWQDTGLFTRE